MNYEIKQFPDKKFTDKMDLIRFIKKNQEELLFLKKSEYKTNVKHDINLDLKKEYNPIIERITSDIIEVKAVINTTNIIDSHLDLHLESVWNKTVADNKTTYQLQEHKHTFDGILSAKASQANEQMNFRDLGLDVDFDTIANVNTFTLSRSKNKTMFDAYANGEVMQHSVGMRYVNLSFAVADEDNQKEMDYFNEMLAKAVNPEVGLLNGYFWVVNEAKKIEGSAVLFGSNSITPTLYVKNYEPSLDTSKVEPSSDTHKQKVKFNINQFN
jgi:HKD family nuclease